MKMTIEESIEWLVSRKEHYEMDDNSQELAHALKMAIDIMHKYQNDLKGDYVKRTEVKKIAKEMYLEVANMELDVKTISDCISYTSSKCREVFERKLKALPSVTIQETRKGHWIEHPHEWGTNWEYSMYECSECNEYTVGDSDFCPNCGADMREEKK